MTEHLTDVELTDEQMERSLVVYNEICGDGQALAARLIVHLRDALEAAKAEQHRRREQAVFYAELAYGRPQKPGRYTIEPHGDGYALYSGRDQMHHGFNLARITETTPDVLKRIEQALNAMPPETTGDSQPISEYIADLERDPEWKGALDGAREKTLGDAPK